MGWEILVIIYYYYYCCCWYCCDDEEEEEEEQKFKHHHNERGKWNSALVLICRGYGSKSEMIHIRWGPKTCWNGMVLNAALCEESVSNWNGAFKAGAISWEKLQLGSLSRAWSAPISEKGICKSNFSLSF